MQLFLYVSTRRADLTPKEIERIVQQSRDRNYNRGIRGALLFDGERFAQLLIGFPKEVLNLVERISIDARHHQMVVLCNKAAGHNLHFSQAGSAWRAGSVDAQSLDRLCASEDPLASFLCLLKAEALQ